MLLGHATRLWGVRRRWGAIIILSLELSRQLSKRGLPKYSQHLLLCRKPSLLLTRGEIEMWYLWPTCMARDGRAGLFTTSYPTWEDTDLQLRFLRFDGYRRLGIYTMTVVRKVHGVLFVWNCPGIPLWRVVPVCEEGWDDQYTLY